MSTTTIVRLTTLVSLVAGSLWLLQRQGRHQAHRLAAKKQHVRALQTWEAEGGSPPPHLTKRRAFIRPVTSW